MLQFIISLILFILPFLPGINCIVCDEEIHYVYLPIVTNPQPPLFNEQMIDLYYDINLPVEEYEVWAYLDPSPHIAHLQNIMYTPPEGYRVKGLWFYAYEDSIYHSPAYSLKDVWGCMRAFTFEDGGDNELIGGEWCIFHETDGIPNVYGDIAIRFTNTSPYTVDIMMFQVRLDPHYCPQCVPGQPPEPPGGE